MESDVKNITWNNKNRKWIVRAKIDNIRTYLGSFDTIDEAKQILIQNNIPLIPKNQNTKYSLDRDYFSIIDSAEKAFWMGFICADGTVKSMRKVNCFKITQDNDTLLNELKNDLSFTGNVVHNEKKQKGRFSDNSFYELTIYDKHFSQSLLDAGKTRYKADQINIPHSIPKHFIIDFIRGYFEGDGSIHLDKITNNWKLQISGEMKLLEEFKEHLKLGGIYQDKKIGVYMINGNKQVKSIMDSMYYSDDLYGIKNLKYKGW